MCYIYKIFIVYGHVKFCWTSKILLINTAMQLMDNLVTFYVNF